MAGRGDRRPVNGGTLAVRMLRIGLNIAFGSGPKLVLAFRVTVHRGTVPFAFSGENCLRRPVNGYPFAAFVIR